jgi:signal transduction histidine kinase
MQRDQAARDDTPEAHFEREGLERCRSGARFFCVFAIALLILSAIYSRLYEAEIFDSLLHIRVIALAAAVGIYWVLGTPRGARRPRQLAVALTLVIALNIVALAQWTGGQHSPQYDRLSLLILVPAILMSWNAAWALIACTAVVGPYVVVSTVNGELGTPPFDGHVVRMLGAGVMAVATAVARERLRWSDLWRAHMLTEDRRRAEAEVRRLNEELEQRVLERTAALRASEERARALFEAAHRHQAHLAHVLRVTTVGGMVAELAHELNQPLGAIVNFANGAVTRLRQNGAAPELVDAVARIAAEGMRAAEIIRRVREFVRPGGTAREPVDLNGLVREAALLVEADRREQIALHLQLDPALPAVPVDRIQVEQVILNLLRNAIESMLSSSGDAHELVVQTVARGDREVEVRVRDTGAGVAPGVAERIFDAFFTTKPGGLGMGLSISRSIVEAYGGGLWAQANADRGMTFSFTLPTSEVGAEKLGGDPFPDPPPWPEMATGEGKREGA